MFQVGHVFPADVGVGLQHWNIHSYFLLLIVVQTFSVIPFSRSSRKPLFAFSNKFKVSSSHFIFIWLLSISHLMKHWRVTCQHYRRLFYLFKQLVDGRRSWMKSSQSSMLQTGCQYLRYCFLGNQWTGCLIAGRDSCCVFSEGWSNLLDLLHKHEKTTECSSGRRQYTVG